MSNHQRRVFHFFALLLAFATFYGGVHAQEDQPYSNWRLIGNVSAEMPCRMYIDPSSVASKGPHIKAWIMISCEKPYPSQVAGRAPYYSWIELFYFDCKERMYAEVSSTNYSGKYAHGIATETAESPVKAESFKDAPPYSNISLWMDIACKISK